jgi:hypothetical protein
MPISPLIPESRFVFFFRQEGRRGLFQLGKIEGYITKSWQKKLAFGVCLLLSARRKDLNMAAATTVGEEMGWM